MKLFHTSDWHLGRSLHGQKRYREHQEFLHWLEKRIEAAAPNLLIIAGDIFDTGTPSNQALEMYYSFLCRVAASPCEHVVVVGGNHDSPSCLNAPREVLRHLQVHVVGSALAPREEVLLLRSLKGEPRALCCAVPYLRDREVRCSREGETAQEKETELLRGISQHYKDVFEEARKILESLERPIPLIATGHLFAAGGKTWGEDGVRELYVGNLARIGEDIFPPRADYVALGHLHSCQRVGTSERIWYSGAPLPMSFGEPEQKYLLEVDLRDGAAGVTRTPIPLFQRLVRVEGSLKEAEAELEELAARKESCWVDVALRDSGEGGALRERLDNVVAGSPVEILRIRRMGGGVPRFEGEEEGQSLRELDPRQVFARRLEYQEALASLSPEEREGAELLFRQVLRELEEEDRGEKKSCVS